MLGVGTTSIKRWADSGVLPCVRTPGGHRRFPRDKVIAMLGDLAETETVSAERIDRWVALLVRGTGENDVGRELEREHEMTDSWWRVCEQLAAVLEEIGRRWERDEISVLQEHLASERLARGLKRQAEALETPVGAPVALLVAAEGDEHTLGLALVELVLRDAGWMCRWSGRGTPRESLDKFLDSDDIHLLAVSASASSTDEVALAEQAAWYGRLCKGRDVHLLLGGSGAWPEHPAYGQRITSLGDLDKAARSLKSRSPLH